MTDSTGRPRGAESAPSWRAWITFTVILLGLFLTCVATTGLSDTVALFVLFFCLVVFGIACEAWLKWRYPSPGSDQDRLRDLMRRLRRRDR